MVQEILRTSAGSLWSAGHLELPLTVPAATPAQLTGWLPGIDAGVEGPADRLTE